MIIISIYSFRIKIDYHVSLKLNYIMKKKKTNEIFLSRDNQFREFQMTIERSNIRKKKEKDGVGK